VDRQTSKTHVLVTGGAGFIGQRSAACTTCRTTSTPASRRTRRARTGAASSRSSRARACSSAPRSSPRCTASTTATATASRTSTCATACASAAGASPTSPRASCITWRASRPAGRRWIRRTPRASASAGASTGGTSTTTDGDYVTTRVELLPAAERAAWEVVAAAQEAAQRRDVPAVHALLAHPTRWPEDLSLLIWAIRVCEASGALELAEASSASWPAWSGPLRPSGAAAAAPPA